MRFLPRFLNILSVTALMVGIAATVEQTQTLASLSAPGSTVLDRPIAEGLQFHQAADVIPVVYQQADAGLQLIVGVLLIVLGFFLHALARMQNGERPVHITVKPKSKRRVWYWVDMRM